MHRPIARRTVLRGLGAALALPWMEAMAPAVGSAETLAQPPLRNAFLFMPNGFVPEHWTPPGHEANFKLTRLLKPMASVKDQLTIFEGLWHEKTLGRNGHWPKVPAWLSGGWVVRTGGADMDTGGTSIDQVLAREIGHRTPLPSLELGVDAAYSGVDNVGGGFTRIYGSHIAWRDPGTPVPKEIIPQLAFDRLFRTRSTPVVSGFTPNQESVTKSLQRDESSVLDLVREDAKSLERKISGPDRVKLGEYLESVRSIERRIETALKPQKRWINAGRFDLPRPGQGIPDSHEEHVDLMLDIMLLAFWTDTTRVSTFMFGNAQTGRNFGFLDGVSGSFHGLSHHREEAKGKAMYDKIGLWHCQQVGKFLEKMNSLDEGNGSLLDNSIVMFGSSLRDGNSHDSHDLPILLAGRGAGTIKPGRRIITERDTPLCNLLLTLLKKNGVDADTFGDSTGIIRELMS